MEVAMNNRRENQGAKLPLHDEAVARKKWRGGETLLEGNEKDLGLPASETDDARSVTDREAGDGRPSQGRAGNFPPPD